MKKRTMQFLVKRQILQTIRESRHLKLEHAARLTGIAEGDLASWEAEDSSIAYSDLKKLGRAYKKSWLAFLAEEAAPPEEIVHDQRIGGTPGTLDPSVIFALDDAKTKLEIANELDIGNTLDLPKFEHCDAEDLGSKFRQHIGLSIEKQKKGMESRSPLRFWSEILDEMGVTVFQRPLYGDNVRAFSLRDGNRAAITLNSEDYDRARVFSMFHELCHIYLNETGLCDLFEKKNGKFSKLEAYCNAFAAAFLIPLADLTANTSFLKLRKGNIDPDLVRRIASNFAVSELSVYRRLVDTGLINMDEYLRIQAIRLSQFRRNIKVEDDRRGGSFYNSFFASRSVPFVSGVLNAFSDGKIEYRRVGSVLGVNPKLIPEVRERLQKYRS